MLKLLGITKDYKLGDTRVEALKGVDIEFRKNEFVSILGPSGCGKTTLLNIIGGLDRYTKGDLVIKGSSTKSYKDKDWDTYRNHSIGFVFQSYNLIPHQSVLSNVELALTLSGVSRAERRKRARIALEKVGLHDQLSKKPNQMSGGQMQRVAIARALVNDPEILLADEPTGALDSETSLQIMELLKEIAKDRLVIMVTHNPDLANEYSSRIIKLVDGKVIDDSNPYTSDGAHEEKSKKKRPSMSWFTAFSLSCNNLLTKKARTFLTSFAGSIGIIGIALILSLSSGVQTYIDRLEEDTLSSYPIMIEKSATDLNEMIASMMEENAADQEQTGDKIYSNDIMTEMMATMVNNSMTNDLSTLKDYIENEGKEIADYTSDIKYKYSTTMNIYTENGVRVNPSEVFEKLGVEMENTSKFGSSPMMSNADVWQELLNNDELLEKQYEKIAGRMPKKYDEIVVIVDENNQISDYTLYTLGLKDSDELADMMERAMKGEKLEKPTQSSYTYDEILGLSFKLLINSDYFAKNDAGIWEDKSDDELYLLDTLKNSLTVKVVGILRANSDASSTTMANGAVGYLSSLSTHLINEVNSSEIVKQQQENPDIDVFTGLAFSSNKELTMADLEAYIKMQPAESQAQFGAYITQMRAQGMSDSQIVERFSSYLQTTQSSSTYDENLKILGVSDLSDPSGIYIYPKDFEAKETITSIINEYNYDKDKGEKITYTDYVGLMLSSITTIINAISYILIAFVSISLIVSSIMIGIITYISVLERTKEIGILRAMGASKGDISNVFNAETIIIGLSSGLLGIGVTMLLLIPINAIIENITTIANIAILPSGAAVVLVLISVFLTFIAGLFPSRMAAKKDPVNALRTE